MTAALGFHGAAATAVTFDHVLDCLAGSFATEAQALAVLQQLQDKHDVMPRRAVLLAPSQSGWLGFKRQSRAWARRCDAEGQPWAADAPLMALLCGFILSLGVAAWLVLGDGLDAGLIALSCLLAAVLGGAGGWAVAASLPLASQYRRFDGKVRDELAAGRWVVLAHDVPWQQQGGVLALMRSRAIGWCVVSASRRCL